MTNIRRCIVRLTATATLVAVAFSASMVPADDGDRGGTVQSQDMPSELVLDVLSGNISKLLADNLAELLSGNTAKLLADNEPSLLSGNEAELLSGNETELFSGNAPQIFSNIKVEIEISNSGNTAPPFRPGVPPVKAKIREKQSRLDADKNGTVSFHEFTAAKSGRKARRAKKRFETLDTDGNGMLTFEEFTSRANDARAVAASKAR